MPIPEEFKAPFHFHQHYHITFRSIDGIPLFKTINERSFFLEKWKRFTEMIFETWAYCLLSNHTHIIIQIKSQEQIIEALSQLMDDSKSIAVKKFLEQPSEDLFQRAVERQINSFMVSYANTYNNYSERKGGVFQQPFRRSLIADDAHLQQAVICTHANAQKHRLVKNFIDYPHHSYHSILNGNTTFVNVQAVLAFFGSRENFIQRHKDQIDYFYNDED
ncbi:MAG: hypothetical protein K2X48_01225 [Chitinophagaceae bacterium]|nr:hypothetical protein [Chitinophagaceae bacterium]